MEDNPGINKLISSTGMLTGSWALNKHIQYTYRVCKPQLKKLTRLPKVLFQYKQSKDLKSNGGPTS